MGVYCLNKSIIEELPKNTMYGFDNLMYDNLETKNVKIIPFNGFWLDIGRPEDYDYANKNYLDIKKDWV